ncbi:MAG TPA: GNAT family N-acetyltransferase [Actinomycetota bacterium]|nr:GNAT family N-acetyltransferase [Actinomycetota bacterium]
MRRLEPHDIGRAAEVLAEAFTDDPFSMWLFPEKRLRERLVRSWAMQLRVVYIPKGHSYATDGLEGVALWTPPPGLVRSSLSEQLRLLFPYIRILGPGRLPRAAYGFGIIERAHPSEPHWYLSAIGVAPHQQRKGFGGTLLQPVLDRADRENTLTYLETFRPENVPYYERFGFRVVGEADIADGPHMWSMSRIPS